MRALFSLLSVAHLGNRWWWWPKWSLAWCRCRWWRYLHKVSCQTERPERTKNRAGKERWTAKNTLAQLLPLIQLSSQFELVTCFALITIVCEWVKMMSESLFFLLFPFHWRITFGKYQWQDGRQDWEERKTRKGDFRNSHSLHSSSIWCQRKKHKPNWRQFVLS